VNSCREISGRHVWVCSSHLLRSFAPLDSRGRPHACCLCGLSRGDYTRRRGGCLLPGLWILVLTAVLSLGTVNLGRMGASGSRSSGNARSGLDCPGRRKWRHIWLSKIRAACCLRCQERKTAEDGVHPRKHYWNRGRRWQCLLGGVYRHRVAD
jgi:hypothetical protein